MLSKSELSARFSVERKKLSLVAFKTFFSELLLGKLLSWTHNPPSSTAQLLEFMKDIYIKPYLANSHS